MTSPKPTFGVIGMHSCADSHSLIFADQLWGFVDFSSLTEQDKTLLNRAHAGPIDIDQNSIYSNANGKKRRTKAFSMIGATSMCTLVLFKFYNCHWYRGSTLSSVRYSDPQADQSFCLLEPSW
jgi:hypothetical protein